MGSLRVRRRTRDSRSGPAWIDTRAPERRQPPGPPRCRSPAGPFDDTVKGAPGAGRTGGHTGARRKETDAISRVRVLVGTRKGAFILTSDERACAGTSAAPTSAGWEIYHVEGLAGRSRPAVRLAVERLVRSGDPAIRRRRPTWAPVGNQFAYDGVPGTHQWYDGTPHPWEFTRVWHLEPSLTDPDVVYAGVEDAAMFRTDRRRTDLARAAGLRGHGSGPSWTAGRRRNGAPHDPPRPVAAGPRSSSPSRRRARSESDDDGDHVAADQSRTQVGHAPDPDAEVGHCVHRIATHPSRPDVLFMQKHWDVMRSDDGGAAVAGGQRRTCRPISGSRSASTPTSRRRLCRAHQERLGALPAGRPAARLSQPHRRGRVGAARRTGLPQQHCYVNVLRDGHGRRRPRFLRCLLRDDRRSGVRLGRRRRPLGADRARSPRRAVGQRADLAMIRVVLPAHLRTLACVTRGD